MTNATATAELRGGEAGRLRATARRWLRARPLAAWTGAAIALALILRAPWLGEPLGNDEGGLVYVAGEWSADGSFPYGDYFLDRPPLLLFLFRLAEAGGASGVRALGAIAVAVLVLLVALATRELGGDHAARWAAMVAAVLGSSLALGSVFTPAELIAVVPSTASVLLLLLALRRPRKRALLLAGAGALAVAALLVKQSFGDALAAGTVYLLASAWLSRREPRAWLPAAGAYLAGAFVPLAGLMLWKHLAGVPDGSILYALFGFRLDGLGALAGSAGDLVERLGTRLLAPLAASGLLLVGLWSLPGARSLRDRPVACATVVAWGLAGAGAVLLGGSYWAHYLIALVPVAAITAGLALSAARTRPAWLTGAVLALIAVGGLVVGPSVRAETASDLGASTVGSFVAGYARPHDTIYVRYSQANVIYYSGLRSPYPYQWSLMLRAIPGAQRELRSLLGSPRRPTWVVEWEPATAYGLDRSGATARLLDRNYRQVATVCGRPILLERGMSRPVRRPRGASCGQNTILPEIP